MPIAAGTWQVIVGAYKVAPEGVTVRYEVTLTEKQMRRFQGDTHMHTTGSDGVLATAELVDLCRRQRLDFAIITDHNNYSGNDHLPAPSDMTVIPGAEWTHYNGHAGFLGVRPSLPQPVLRQHARTGARANRGSAPRGGDDRRQPSLLPAGVRLEVGL